MTIDEIASRRVEVTYYLPKHMRDPEDEAWITVVVPVCDVIAPRHCYNGKYEFDYVEDGERVFKVSCPDEFEWFKFNDINDERTFIEFSEMLTHYA